jgi:transglutaminase-like putative cysteine protease
MNQQREPCGWQIHHHEQLFFRANVGAPTIRLKFFHYPSYRQTVTINQSPAYCKIKKKRNNTFFLFQQKVRTKGTISLERIISIYPQPSTLPVNKTWGRISNISLLLQRKYKQSFSYWPMSSAAIQDVAQERWFAADDLYDWVQTTSRYIITKIKHPEKQEKRLGAEQALRTGSGDCDEFTDLFITLARIRGVPCRRLTGYFIKKINAEPEPHAWAEILSPIIGWIPTDIALHNIGNHTTHYVISKIEEFNPFLLDYQILKQTSAVHYHWERPLPLIIPLYEKHVF